MFVQTLSIFLFLQLITNPSFSIFFLRPYLEKRKPIFFNGTPYTMPYMLYNWDWASCHPVLTYQSLLWIRNTQNFGNSSAPTSFGIDNFGQMTLVDTIFSFTLVKFWNFFLATLQPEATWGKSLTSWLRIRGTCSISTVSNHLSSEFALTKYINKLSLIHLYYFVNCLIISSESPLIPTLVAHK